MKIVDKIELAQVGECVPRTCIVSPDERVTVPIVNADDFNPLAHAEGGDYPAVVMAVFESILAWTDGQIVALWRRVS